VAPSRVSSSRTQRAYLLSGTGGGRLVGRAVVRADEHGHEVGGGSCGRPGPGRRSTAYGERG